MKPVAIRVVPASVVADLLETVVAMSSALKVLDTVLETGTINEYGLACAKALRVDAVDVCAKLSALFQPEKP